MRESRKGRPRGGLARTGVLSDPDLRRWYDDLRWASKSTGDVHLQRLCAFCDRVGKTPSQVAPPDEGGAHWLLHDFVSSEE